LLGGKINENQFKKFKYACVDNVVSNECSFNNIVNFFKAKSYTHHFLFNFHGICDFLPCFILNKSPKEKMKYCHRQIGVKHEKEKYFYSLVIDIVHKLSYYSFIYVFFSNQPSKNNIWRYQYFSYNRYMDCLLNG